jgi:alanyl-tRNA synthetase
MALFGEKYGDQVRVVEVPGVSMELCGGTHCRHTSEIGLFRIVSETGVAAGVRRIEAVTGPSAFRLLRRSEERLSELAGMLRSRPENLSGRLAQLLTEKEALESLLEDLRKGEGAGEEILVQEHLDGPDGAVDFKAIRLRARNPDDVRAWGDGYRDGGSRRVALVVAELPEGKLSLFGFVSDDLIARGVRADTLVREVASLVGGKGGGRPHMAQAGIGDPEGVNGALTAGPRILLGLLGAAP